MFSIDFHKAFDFGYTLAVLFKNQNLKTSNSSIFSSNSTVSNTSVENGDNTASSEKFDDVIAEFHAKIPDRTETAKQKEDAIQLIDRMLNASDITPSLRNYWQNKKNQLQQELLSIQNYEKVGNGDSFFEISEEMRLHVPDSTKTISEKYLAISFIERMLACEDIPEFEKDFWMNQKEIIKYEIEHFYDN